MNRPISTESRQSNMELLRIAAMFLILLLHADFTALGKPGYADVVRSPVSSLFAYGIEFATITGVNLFVLISGYFSIAWRKKSILGLFFQVLFYLVAVYAVLLVAGQAELSPAGAAACLKMQGYWFVWAYVGLYLFAPVLNAFVERVTQRQLGRFILLFYLFQFGAGWVSGLLPEFRDGYSAVSFLGLYLIGRYIRLYSGELLKQDKYWDLALFFMTVLLCTSLQFIVRLDPGAPGPLAGLVQRMYAYNAPNVVLSSVALFLFFTKLKLRQGLVNRIAVSVFAVYLIHVHSLVWPRYLELVRSLRAAFDSPFAAGAVIFAVLCAVFLACVVVDQVRIYCWERCWRGMERLARRADLRAGGSRP